MSNELHPSTCRKEDKERSLVRKDAVANVVEQRTSKQLTVVNAAADLLLSSFD